jgi:AcrR family transcriptional regulator
LRGDTLCLFLDRWRVGVRYCTLYSPILKPMDRRTQRTRRALYSALLRTLTQRPWEEIDVQSLCDVANVGRSTFYSHFQNRELLLQACFTDICQSFVEAGAARHASSEYSQGTLAFVAPLIEHIGEQRAIFRALLGKRSNAYVRQQFQIILVDLVRAELDRRALRPAWRADALAHAMAGGIFSTIHWWVSGNQPRRAEEVVMLIDSMARCMIDGAT